MDILKNENKGDEEEDDALDEKNNQNFQKTKNIPISTTPLSQKIPLNRLNEKQKLNSFKNLKLKRDNEKDKEKEKINTEKKRKLRRVQTLNVKNPNSYLSKLNNKKEAQKKNHSTIKQNQAKKDY